MINQIYYMVRKSLGSDRLKLYRLEKFENGFALYEIFRRDSPPYYQRVLNAAEIDYATHLVDTNSDQIYADASEAFAMIFADTKKQNAIEVRELVQTHRRDMATMRRVCKREMKSVREHVVSIRFSLEGEE